MALVRFIVQGSTGNEYDVVFVAEKGKLQALCSCPAGSIGTHCKHRIGILTGTTKGILSNNEEEVRTVEKWLIGTPLEAALAHYNECLEEVEEAKRKLNRAKKAFARALSDG